MIRTPTIIISIFSFAMLVTLTACSGDENGSTVTSSPTAAGAVVVRALEGIRWENETYTAEAGDVRIVLENTSSIPHNLALIDSDSTELPNTLETPSRSDTDEATVSLEPGVYSVICKIPGHSNMNATLTVD